MTEIKVTFTQITVARDDADIVNGNASKHRSKLRNSNQLQWFTASECYEAAGPHATWWPTTDPLRPCVHLLTADIRSEDGPRCDAVDEVPEAEAVD